MLTVFVKVLVDLEEEADIMSHHAEVRDLKVGRFVFFVLGVDAGIVMD